MHSSGIAIEALLDGWKVRSSSYAHALPDQSLNFTRVIMSKRSYASFAAGEDTQAVSQILQYAEDLKTAALAHQKELEAGRQPVETSLSDISAKILPAVQHFSRTSPRAPSSKAPKVDSDVRPKAGPGSIVVPSPVSLPPWHIEDIRSSLPPLPPIVDPALEQAALTHSGRITNRGEQSYERLEWLGDAYLYLMASAMIYQTFPDLAAGRCAQLREILVRNTTLSSYTMDYGLNKRMRFPTEFDLHNRANTALATEKTKRKVLGDIFESYVAGVILGTPNGLALVSSWMKALWSRELAEEIQKEHGKRAKTAPSGSDATRTKDSTSLPVVTEPKVRLVQAIGAKGVQITYRDEGPPGKDKKSGLPWYTVGAYLDGWGETNFRLGMGSALSKKEAGAQAAQAALDNKKMMKVYEQKKKDFVATLDTRQPK